jgi:hypothetical protein
MSKWISSQDEIGFVTTGIVPDGPDPTYLSQPHQEMPKSETDMHSTGSLSKPYPTCLPRPNAMHKPDVDRSPKTVSHHEFRHDSILLPSPYLTGFNM